MDFLKTITKRRSLVSEIIYIALNVGLAILLLLVVRFTNSLVPAIILVLLSKWRVLAVRTRFWLANIQANAVCLIVSLGYVILLSSVNPSVSGVDSLSSLISQLVLATLYIIWLVLLKPQSKRHYMVMQAGIALFVGLTTLYMISYSWIASVVVVMVYLIGYVVARHVLSSYEEDQTVLLSLCFAFIMSQIGWLSHHWAIAYKLPFSANILLPQFSLVSLLIGFLIYKVYDSYYHNQKVRISDIILPMIFSIGLITILLLFRNGIDQIII